MQRTALAALTSAVLLSASATGAAEKVKLLFDGRYTSGGSFQAFQEAVADYEALNPDVTVQYIGSTGHEEQLQKIMVTGAAEGLPDVIHLYNEWMPDFAYNHWLAPPPAEFVARLGNSFYPAALESTTYRGQVLGVPTENQIQALMYSKSALADAGMTPPDTWSELDLMARKLTRKENGKIVRAGLQFDGSGWGYTANFLAQLTADGGQFIDSTGKVAFVSPTGYDVLNRWVDWFRTDPIMGSGLPTKVAMGIGFPWWMSGMQDQVSDLGVTQVPAGSVRRSADHYGWGLYVPANSPHAAEAWKFIEFLALHQTADGITYLGKAMAALGSLPDNRADFDTPAYTKQKAIYQGFSDNFAFAVEEPKWPKGDERQTVLGEEVTAALQGKKSATQALGDAARRMQALLDPFRDESQ